MRRSSMTKMANRHPAANEDKAGNSRVGVIDLTSDGEDWDLVVSNFGSVHPSPLCEKVAYFDAY